MKNENETTGEGHVDRVVMPPSYEINTFDDIVKKIPLERFDDFLDELKTLLTLAKSSYEVCGIFGEQQSDEFMTTPIVWVDDDKKEMRIQLSQTIKK